MRVLHFLDTEQFAGTEQHVLTLCKHLTLLGIKCGVVCRLSNREFAKKVEGSRDWDGFLEAGNSRQILRRLKHIVQEWQPDIVHTHNGRTSLMAARLGKNSPKCVFTQHFVAPGHTHYRGAKRFAAMAMHGVVNARTDKVIAVSEAVRLAMIKREHLPESKIVTIWNGIEPPHITPNDTKQILAQEGFDTHPLFLTIARFAPEKGYYTLLEAVPQVLERCPTARFVWIGSGQQETELRQAIAEKGLQDAILMLGYQDNAANFLECADAFVLPSDCEPFGLVLVEAMMRGVPVIGTDCGGAKEIVAPAVEQNTSFDAVGWLVPPQNSQALAAAMADCANNAEFARRIGENGRKRALNTFTAERMAHQTIAVYEEMLD